MLEAREEERLTRLEQQIAALTQQIAQILTVFERKSKRARRQSPCASQISSHAGSPIQTDHEDDEL